MQANLKVCDVIHLPTDCCVYVVVCRVQTAATVRRNWELDDFSHFSVVAVIGWWGCVVEAHLSEVMPSEIQANTVFYGYVMNLVQALFW